MRLLLRHLLSLIAHRLPAKLHPPCSHRPRSLPCPPPVQGFAPIPVKLPKILGEDLAGVVVEAPEGSKVRPPASTC